MNDKPHICNETTRYTLPVEGWGAWILELPKPVTGNYAPSNRFSCNWRGIIFS